MSIYRVKKPPSCLEGGFLWLLVVFLLVCSGWAAKDRITWLMEVVWVIAALPVLATFARKITLTRLLCWLLMCHALVLIYGGWYTYAETPLGYWLKEVFELQRNPWDRVGHFMQGFTPAILARELLLRFSPLKRGALLAYVVLAICLSFSAFFELLEWWAALAMGSDADAFLATQGDIWDTQWDMFLCLVGAATSLLLLSDIHDAQLGRDR